MTIPYQLAVCEDRLDDPDGVTYSVYFLNNSNSKVDELVISNFGFADGGATSTASIVRKDIPSKGFVEVGQESIDDFDWMLFYDCEVKKGSGSEKIRLRTPKYLPAFHKPVPIPLLNKQGYLIEAAPLT